MKYGIGIDMITVDRCAHWHTKPKKQLDRLFGQDELDYILRCPTTSAQRFAARFAAKEAFLKALSCLYPENHFSLLTIMRQVSVARGVYGQPSLCVSQKFCQDNSLFFSQVHLSLTHTKKHAAAVVMLVQDAPMQCM
jgi:holo-[acyl-carrier protein] synthase